jgi:ABC-type sugar transport system ATPase subunit
MIELSDISKNFGPVQALKKVNLTVNKGKVLALVGENGAGKSTLMKILSGVYSQAEYSGQIKIDGTAVQFREPRDSESAGICLIHQELSSFLHLNVAENMAVGHWPEKKGIVNFEEMQKQADFWLSQLGADFQSTQMMSELSTGQKQVVEIAKALMKKSDYIILDEPTSSLTKKETIKLFQLLEELKIKNCGIVYISHRMEEIFQLADEVVVLRDGESVYKNSISKVSQEELISHMVGRSLQQIFPTSQKKVQPQVLLKVEQFQARHKKTGKLFGPVTFQLHKGEILGFGGLLGAGRTEIFQALLGDEEYSCSGSIYLNGNQVHLFNQVCQAFQNQISFVSEDRKEKSNLPTRSLDENASILRLSLGSLFKMINEKKEFQRTQEDLKKLKTKFHSPDQLITELSGGNQQKVIFARALQNNPQMMILDEPTRGVDVGAKFEIYELLFQWAEMGMGIFMISSDLPELMAMSDRVLVMAKGKIAQEFSKNELNQENIMKAALSS